MSALHIYKAAAGAGKTHVLVGAYLELALQSPVHFRDILAVTFTNRATQEMKHRILTTLHAMAQGLPTPLSATLCQRYNWDSETLQHRASLVQSHILHDYDHFSVSTIDSFLQTIVRHFARELGLPYRFKIELDVEQVLDQLVGAVTQAAAEDVQLRQWLVRFATHNVLKGQSWRFQKGLKRLGYELFTERFASQEAALVAALQIPGHLEAFLSNINEIINNFEQYLQLIGQKSLRSMQQAGLTVADFAYGARGVAGYLAGLAEKKNFRPTQRSQAALTTLSTWFSQASAHKAAIITTVENSLQPMLEQAIAYYQAQHRRYHTAVAVQQFIYAFGITGHLVAALGKLRTEQNIMLLSDASCLLRQLIGEDDAPFVYEKIGAFYNYFLIDEFQDISDFQWKNLKPLISNGLAGGHMSLVVGDVKQAIYRWRGSNWQLLSNQLATTFENTKQMTLVHNFRSKEAIVRFNNTFFIQASQQLVNHLQEEVNQIDDTLLQHTLTSQLQNFTTAYADSYQEIQAERLQDSDQGYVEINFVSEDKLPAKTSSWKDTVKERLPTLLETLQEDGFAPQEIAFLVRNHAEAQEICQLLLSYQYAEAAKPGYTYAALSAESLYLGHDPGVNIVISALGYLINPADTMAKMELRYLYQRYVCNNTTQLAHDFFQKGLGAGVEVDGLPAALLATWNDLRALPLYACVQQLVSLFQLLLTDHAPFIQALQEVVASYVQSNTGGIYAFLSWWKEIGCSQSIPYGTGHHAVTVLTMHQAKGLQFKVVIIPFCSWSFDHPAQKAPLIWCHTPVEPFACFPSLPICYNKGLEETYYAQAYYEERIQVYVDHFNLLYVAFTRPQDRLYVFAPQLAKPAFKTTAELVYQTVHNTIQPVAANRSYFLNWETYWQAATQKLIIGKPVSINKS